MAFVVSQDLKHYQHLLGEVAQHPLAKASTSFVTSCLLILGLFSFAIRPTIQTIDTLKDQIVLLEELNAQLANKKRLLQQLLPLYQTLLPSLPKIEAALPPNHQFLLFERQLRYLVQVHHLSVQSVTFGSVALTGTANLPLDEMQALEEPADTATTPSATELPVPKTSFSVGVSGTYANIKKFIAQLQLLSRITTFDKISFESSSKTNLATLQDDLIQAVIQGQSYYLAPEATLAKRTTE